MDGEARRSALEAVDKLSRLGLQLDQHRVHLDHIDH